MMSLSLLLNPKVWGVLLILLIFGGAYYEYRSLQNALIAAEASLKQEKTNNIVLRGSIETLTQANSENAIIMQQQIASAKTTVATVNKLSTELKRSNKSLADTQIKIEAISQDPVALSVYLKEAIDGIQTEREVLNPSPAKDAPK